MITPVAPVSGWSNKPPAGVAIDKGHPLSNGLAACWLMNEGSGSTVRDCVSGNMGTLTGSTWTANGVFLNNPDITGSQRITATGWRQANTSHTLGYILLPLGTGNYQFLLDSQSGRCVASLTNTGGTALDMCIYDGANWRIFGAMPSVGTIHKVVFVMDATAGLCRAFADGVQAGTDQTYSATTIGGTTMLGSRYVNSGTSWDSFDGCIMGVFYWNRPLSASEVRAWNASPYCVFDSGKHSQKYLVPSDGVINSSRIIGVR